MDFFQTCNRADRRAGGWVKGKWKGLRNDKVPLARTHWSGHRRRNLPTSGRSRPNGSRRIRSRLRFQEFTDSLRNTFHHLVSVKWSNRLLNCHTSYYGKCASLILQPEPVLAGSSASLSAVWFAVSCLICHSAGCASPLDPKPSSFQDLQQTSCHTVKQTVCFTVY